MHYYSIQMVYFFKKCLDLTASNLNGWCAFFKVFLLFSLIFWHSNSESHQFSACRKITKLIFGIIEEVIISVAEQFITGSKVSMNFAKTIKQFFNES